MTDTFALAKAAVDALKKRGWRCATCESLTGGLICASLVDVPGASAVVRGGLITYQTDTKTLLADVPAEVIEAEGVVSAAVACAMAEGTRLRLDVDAAVSATGLAGPDGGTEACPVGTVYIGLSTCGETKAIRLQLQGDRASVRQQAVRQAIEALRQAAVQ